MDNINNTVASKSNIVLIYDTNAPLPSDWFGGRRILSTTWEFVERKSRRRWKKITRGSLLAISFQCMMFINTILLQFGIDLMAERSKALC